MSWFSDYVAPIGGAIIGGMIGGPAGAAVGAGIGGSISSAQSIKDTNKAQSELSDAQMAFQERMSNTAHQREVDDLRVAGLNPILSARYGGSSTPSGSMAQLHAPQEHLSEGLSNSARVGLESKMNKELIMTERTKQMLNSATALKANNDAVTSAEQAKQSKMHTDVMKSSLVDRKVGEKYKYWINMFNPFNLMPGVSASQRY